MSSATDGSPGAEVSDPRLGFGSLRPSTLRTVALDRLRLLALLRYGGTGISVALIAVGLLGVAAATSGALATGWLVSAVAGARGPSTATAPVVVLAVLIYAGQLAEIATAQVLGPTIARRVDGAVRRRVREIALAPDGIAHLDDAEFRDDVERACDLGLGWRTRSPGNAAVGQMALSFRFLGGLVAAALLGARFPLAAAAVLFGAVFVRTLVRRQWMWLTALDDSRMADNRRAQYLGGLASEAAAAKDVRLFGLADWVVARMRRAAVDARTPSWTARTMILRSQGTSTAVALVSSGVAFWVVGASHQTAGTMARCLALAITVMQLSALGPEAFDIDYGIATVRALDRVTRRQVPAPRASGSPSVSASLPASVPVPVPVPEATVAETSGSPVPTVRFEQVSFAYPGSDRLVLDGLTLEIRGGEVLAVVGVNGAGKSTLVKLMAGLYPPTSGRITVDGVDLADLDPQEWRTRMTALFQDFVHYGTTVGDNVALSAPEHLGDTAGIGAALVAAGAGDLVAEMPDGLSTKLWRGGEGSRGLSGGQWQKLAIARALFAVSHGRRLLVLDEPTAHLDVEAEQEFNDRVTASAGGASVVLISHRLSNVRSADRIVVLDGGGVTEAGSHDELLELDGAYARLWRLQAARFAEAAS